jgi:hypothetical protein
MLFTSLINPDIAPNKTYLDCLHFAVCGWHGNRFRNLSSPRDLKDRCLLIGDVERRQIRF